MGLATGGAQGYIDGAGASVMSASPQRSAHSAEFSFETSAAAAAAVAASETETAAAATAAGAYTYPRFSSI